MRFLKAAIIFTLTAALLFLLASCGSCKHLDENGDGICDKCDKDMPETEELVLIDKGGYPTFQIVLADGVDPTVRLAVTELVSDLAKADIKVDLIRDTDSALKSCEVLIGDVSSRGTRYLFDQYTLGHKGYVIKLVGQKIVINGGSAEALLEALEIFTEDILGFTGDEIWDVTMTKEQEIDERQSDYDITALKLAGEDMRGYTIAIDKSIGYHYTAAKSLQETLYRQTGYRFEIVSLDEADKSIVFKSIPKVFSDESFKISEKNGQLLIECAFDNKLSSALASYLAENIIDAEGEINIEGVVFKKDISFVTYKEFGATDNSKKDNDFPALYNAHVFANISGQNVIVEGSPTYYVTYPVVENLIYSIPIQTNVYWGDMRLIIDDSVIDLHNEEHVNYRGNIFRVAPSYAERAIIFDHLPEGLTINKSTTKIDLDINRPALIVPSNSSHKVYRRRGYSAYRGTDMHEVIVVDAEGNISEDTPPIWDYPEVHTVTVYWLDEEPLVIEGGTVTTIACDESIYGPDRVTRDVYYGRGISVQRSNTTLKNVKHYVEGEITLQEQKEGKIGVAYSGFFGISYCTDVTLKDCVLSGRRCFGKPGVGTTGTYDTQASNACNVVYDGCIQRNFWITVNSDGTITPASEDTPGAVLSMDSGTKFGIGQMHWGIAGSNFCKNLQYINSTLSRYDAHMGVYSGKIINSKVCDISLVGAGTMIIEDTVKYAHSRTSSIFSCRYDYGATWDGVIKLKNTKAYINSEDPAVFDSSYQNWYFGYPCAYPSIELDNVDFYDMETKEPFAPGTEIALDKGTYHNIGAHLDTLISTSDGKNDYHPIYSYVDDDGDGFVDGHPDRIQYNPELADSNTGGVTDADSMKNLNPIKPPEYIKIINNDGVDADGDGTADGGYRFVVTKTALSGFYENTKFYLSLDKYYTGTGESKKDGDETFIFR